MRGWVYKALMIPAPPAAPPLPRGPHTAAPALRPAVPWPVNLARIVLLLESTTWVGIGLAVVAILLMSRWLNKERRGFSV